MKPSPRNGFSLSEVALALGVSSFCLMTLMALIPVGIQRNHEADSRSAMVNLATLVTHDLVATPEIANSKSPVYQFQIPAVGSSSGTIQSTFVNSASGGEYRVTVYFYPPSTGRAATAANILITWPGQADPNAALAPSHYNGMYETVVSLDRN
jgi:uncharacterized protein (TIGR02598 family)